MNPSTTNMTLNLQLPNVAQICFAVQGDTRREANAQLVDGALAWTPPAGAAAMIRFHKPDGTTGFYDTMEDGETPAVVISGSTAVIRYAYQVLTVPGDVVLQLNFYDSQSDRLTTFAWTLLVQPSVLTDAQFISTDYYNILAPQIAAAIAAAEQAEQAVAILNGAVQYLPQSKTSAEQAQARQNIGLGALATMNTVPISAGGTDATSASAALANLGGVPMVRIPGMTANTMEHLLGTLNYGTTTSSYIPVGASILVVGNTSNQNRVALFCLKLSNEVGSAYTVSPYTELSGKTISLTSSGWVAT